MTRALILAMLLPAAAQAETLFSCDMQFYPATPDGGTDATLTLSQDGPNITAVHSTRHTDPATFNCTGNSSGGYECYGFFYTENGSARQLNIFDGVPETGSPIAISALTLSFLGRFITPDGYDRSNLTDRRIALSLYEVTTCDAPLG